VSADLSTHARTPGAVSLLEVAEALRPLAGRVTNDGGLEALEELLAVAMARVPGATSAALTVRHRNRVTTAVVTDETARRADRFQDRAASGPGVDAALDGALYVTGDVAGDGRWPRWGALVNEELGVSSVLAQRLTLLDEPDAVATLALYSDAPDAFDDAAVAMALVLASHGSLLVTATLARGRATHLTRALESNREIGVAMGILMQRHEVSRDEAFAMLRVVSQDSNRKLSAVASDVADTGVLPGRATVGP
jgi:hypothetical protein